MARGPIPDFPADRPTVPDVLSDALALGERTGWIFSGGLHLFLADGNTGISFATSALDDPDPEVADLARRLSRMTPTQRGKVYRHLHPRG